MAPITWLKRLCSAPGKTRKVKPSWWMKRSRWTGRLLISAVSRASARMNPWTGSRMDSKLVVVVVAAGEVPPGAQEVQDLLAVAEDRQDGETALRQGLLQELELAQGGQVEPRGDAVDQLFEGALAGELLQVAAAQGEALAGL